MGVNISLCLTKRSIVKLVGPAGISVEVETIGGNYKCKIDVLYTYSIITPCNWFFTQTLDTSVFRRGNVNQTC